MSQYSNITLAILAGGKASRMGGRNKALLEIDGQSFISRIHQSLSPLFSNSIIIANDLVDYKLINAAVYPDVIKDIGPLGGIHSALANSPDPIVFVISCDMPFADASIASILIEEFQKLKPDVLIPVIDSYKEPLFAIYSKSIVGKIESIITETKGRPITDLLKVVDTLYFDLPKNSLTKKCFTNINYLDDLKEIQ